MNTKCKMFSPKHLAFSPNDTVRHGDGFLSSWLDFYIVIFNEPFSVFQEEASAENKKEHGATGNYEAELKNVLFVFNL